MPNERLRQLSQSVDGFAELQYHIDFIRQAKGTLQERLQIADNVINTLIAKINKLAEVAEITANAATTAATAATTAAAAVESITTMLKTIQDGKLPQ